MPVYVGRGGLELPGWDGTGFTPWETAGAFGGLEAEGDVRERTVFDGGRDWPGGGGGGDGINANPDEGAGAIRSETSMTSGPLGPDLPEREPVRD